MSTGTPRIIPVDPTDTEAAAKATEFNGPHADLCRAWAGPPEPIERQLARMGDQMPDALDGLDLGRAVLGMAEAAMLDNRPEVRRLGVDVLFWLRDGARISLDRWLGLSEGGRGAFRETVEIAERNAALRFVARLPRYADLPPKAAARLIASRWTRWGTARHERDEEGQTFALLDRAGHKALHYETIRKIITREE